MGMFDFLTSTRRPAAGVQALPAEELYARLLHLNRPTAPYRIADGTREHVDLIAEWKIVDAEWYELFAKAGTSKVFRIFLKFDEPKHQVRALDREYGVTWRAGVPQLSIAASGFRGQKQSIEFGKAYGFTETLEPGTVYNYRFDSREMKKPIQDAITGGGWTYKGVAFGRL
jgi:hypothetical protein